MDLAFLHFPQEFRRQDLWKLLSWTQYSVKKAKQIFAISDSTKQDLIKQYQLDPSSITVTYPGVNSPSKPTPLSQLRKKYQFTKPFFLFIGTLQPRKNLIRLIKAFTPFASKYQLLLAGKPGWLYQPVMDLVDHRAVLHLGYVSEADKAGLLQQAAALVLPSLYEGFGLPVVEAMQQDCLVVVSRNSSLPEIVGRSGIYIENPHSIASIRQGLEKVLKLSKAKKATKIKQAKRKLKQFDWKKTAKITLKTINEL